MFFAVLIVNAEDIVVDLEDGELNVTKNFFVNTDTLYVNSSNNRVGIGTTSPGEKLDVRGPAIFNEDGGDNDFRVEGDTESKMFWVDASADAIGIRTNTLHASTILSLKPAAPADLSDGMGTGGMTGVYLISQDGGDDSGDNGGGFCYGANAGQMQYRSGAGGDGKNASTKSYGGSGGIIQFVSGAGGTAQSSADANSGGAGGLLSFSSGAGGSVTTSTDGNNIAGNAGQFQVTGGAGGLGMNFGAGNATGGAGAGITFTAGSGGGTVGFNKGDGGDGGYVIFRAGSGGSKTGSGTAGEAGYLEFKAGTGAVGGSDGYMFFKIGNDELMRLTSDDKVAIGTTNATAKLEVVGTSGDLLNISNGSDTHLIVSNQGNVGVGIISPTYPLTVYGNVSEISIWADGNVSATGYITRTSVFDTSKNVWDYIYNADDYLTTSGEVNHTKFYGYTGESEITDYSRPEEEIYYEEECEEIITNCYETTCNNEIVCRWELISGNHYEKICENVEQCDKTRVQNCSISYGEECNYIDIGNGVYEKTCEDVAEETCIDIETCMEYNCYNITKTKTIYPYTTSEKGVNLNAEIDLLRQAVYELKTELCNKDGSYAWC